MDGAKCTAIRADGSPCRAAALLNDEDGTCLWHSERLRDMRLSNARKSRPKRTIELPSANALTPTKTRELLAAASAALLNGSIDPYTYRSLAYGLMVDRHIRSSEQVDSRLAELEEQVESIGTGRRPASGSNGHRRETAESLRAKRDQLIGG